MATETPATTIMALRGAPELLGPTAREREAEAAETVIHPGTPETAHGQEGALWTLTVKLPPEAGNCNAVGETE
jgi:hypothetical protein